MVWGGVSQHHQTELVVIAGNLNAVRYREDILLLHVVPVLQAHPDMTLQHDNNPQTFGTLGDELELKSPKKAQCLKVQRICFMFFVCPL